MDIIKIILVVAGIAALSLCVIVIAIMTGQWAVAGWALIIEAACIAGMIREIIKGARNEEN